MHIQETPIPQAYLLIPQLHHDSRGFFEEIFSASSFHKSGLANNFSRLNSSVSEQRGTLRGLHYQAAPYTETKLIRCLSGSIWDCILDLRFDSPTFGKWYATELSVENRHSLYVPKGCAHGFITLTGKSEVLYLSDKAYSPASERGVRWNDSRFRIPWPLEPTVMSERDLALPDFDESSTTELKL